MRLLASRGGLHGHGAFPGNFRGGPRELLEQGNLFPRAPRRYAGPGAVSLLSSGSAANRSGADRGGRPPVRIECAMRIAIDVAPAHLEQGGIGRTTRELVRAAVGADQDHQWTLLAP